MARELLTDSEYAVTIDSLAQMRDWIKAQAPIYETDTPNIDSALDKLRNNYLPTSNGIWIEVNND